MNSDLHLFNQLFEEGEDPSFNLALSLPSFQELSADWLDLFLQLGNFLHIQQRAGGNYEACTR